MPTRSPTSPCSRRKCCRGCASLARNQIRLLRLPHNSAAPCVPISPGQEKPMADAEIVSLRAKLASRPRSDDYRQRRRDFDARSLEYGVASDVTVEPVTANGVRAEWTSTPQDGSDAALLYLHGGGYVIGSLDSHRHLVAEAGRATGCWALALDYRLAPRTHSPRRSRTTSPAIATSLLAASNRAVSRSPATALAAGSSLRRCWRSATAGFSQPGCGWCISPWVDMEVTGETMVCKATVDPTVSFYLLARARSSACRRIRHAPHWRDRSAPPICKTGPESSRYD